MEGPADLDRVSNLPKDVMDSILIRLPIRDAVRTSVLSSKWRNKWVTIPQLVFLRELQIPPSNSPELMKINIVDQILLRHSGPIHTFKCSFYLQSCAAIDRWILFLSSRGIKKFILDIGAEEGGENYKIPSCLFSCQEMTHLELFQCSFKPPPAFKKLCSLTCLDLQWVFIDNDTLEQLISNCPLLERLILNNNDVLTRLNIHIQSLRFLSLVGPFEVVNFQSAPLLADLTIDFSSPVLGGEILEQDSTCNLVKDLGCLYGLERLKGLGYFLQFLSIESIPEKLRTSYNHLKDLSLCINVENSKEILTVCALCNSSPNLQKLSISGYSDPQFTCVPSGNFCGALEQSDCLFRHLQTVKISEILGKGLELEFIKFILANATVLKALSFSISSGMASERLRIFEELLRFRRASPHAEIRYCGLEKI